MYFAMYLTNNLCNILVIESDFSIENFGSLHARFFRISYSIISDLYMLVSDQKKKKNARLFRISYSLILAYSGL
jgi:hypothetical protein